MPRAGAFPPRHHHSTLIESGVKALDRNQASASAELFLSKFGLKKTQLDELHRLPVERLVAALTGGGVASGTQPGDAASSDISTQFSAVVDGVTVPAQPYDPVASPISADIPIICGSNETEGVPYADLNDPFWSSEITTDAALGARVRALFKIDDAEAARLIALYRSGRPSDSQGTLALIMAADNTPTRLASYVFADPSSRPAARPRSCIPSRGVRQYAVASCGQCTRWSCRSFSIIPTTSNSWWATEGPGTAWRRR
jgi:para-nitrobenzyl esterase